MKPFVSALFIAAAITVSTQPATSQDATSHSASEDIKQIPTTLPNGSPVRFAALNISRNWTESVVHLRGDVRVEIWISPKPATHQVMVLRADTVEYNEETGEIKPYGHVRVTVEDVK